MDLELRKRLLEMVEEDRRVAAELAASGDLYRGYAPRMAEVHGRNARQLEAILDERQAWLGKPLVGEDGAHAAWLVLQHAIGHPQLQRRGLSLLQDAVARHEADPANAAFLEDRICRFENRAQRYGTQFSWDDTGQMSPWRLEDPERVDEYRRSVGLGSLAERIAEVRREAAGEPRPVDVRKWQDDALAWAKSVGWL